MGEEMKVNQLKLTELTWKILDASKGKKMNLGYEMNKKEYLEFKKDTLKDIDEKIKLLKSGDTKESQARKEKWKKIAARSVFVLVAVGMIGRPFLIKLYKWFMLKFTNTDDE